MIDHIPPAMQFLDGRRPRRSRRALFVYAFALGAALAIVAAGAASGPVDPCPAAGKGGAGWCGDGGPATSARLAYPGGVAAAANGGFLIADTSNNVVRRVSPTGIIKRIAGIGLPGDSGDGGPATGATLTEPTCVAEAADGAVLIRDVSGIRRVAPNGIIATVQGPEPCRAAQLPSGDVLVADTDSNVIRRVARNGTTTIAAGTGACGSAGDGVAATKAQLALPRGVAALPDGGFLIADTENHLIRLVSPNGIITTVAGRDPPILACGASGEYGTPIYLILRAPLRGRAHRSLTVHYETTYDVSAVFTIKRGSRVMARNRRTAESGSATAVLRVSLRAGKYSLELRGSGVATVAGGDEVRFTKTDVEPLVIGR